MSQHCITVLANASRPSDFRWGDPHTQMKARLPGRDAHHLEGKRAGCPRGRNRVSKDEGQKATWGDQRGWPAGQTVWKRRGGLETCAQVRRGVAAPGAALSRMSGNSLPIVLQTWHFFPLSPPNRASQLCILVTRQQMSLVPWASWSLG